MDKERKESNYLKGLNRRIYIEKAHEIIQNEGIGAMSIRKIAKEMGCSTASLYRYFDNLSELLYYAELRTLKDYIYSLNLAQKSWHNVWRIYVGVWDCYAREAFQHPEAYELLFFGYTNEKLNASIKEYYEMFPEDLEDSNQFFSEMLLTPSFMGRDFEMCKKCIQEDAITYENARVLNRIVCMLFKGYFKTVLDEGIRAEELEERVHLFVDDIDAVVTALASDLKGYKGYRNN